VWNANGLIQRIKEVEEFLSTQKKMEVFLSTQKEVEVFLSTQKIDILLVSETNFTERNDVKIPACTTYATNNPDRRTHGGSAIIIRKDIKYHKLAKCETDHNQGTNTSIEDGWKSDHLDHLLAPTPRN
jgi:ABC-type phosphate/phosphonate transport system substrate-binding protein